MNKLEVTSESLTSENILTPQNSFGGRLVDYLRTSFDRLKDKFLEVNNFSPGRRRLLRVAASMSVTLLVRSVIPNETHAQPSITAPTQQIHPSEAKSSNVVEDEELSSRIGFSWAIEREKYIALMDNREINDATKSRLLEVFDKVQRDVGYRYKFASDYKRLIEEEPEVDPNSTKNLATRAFLDKTDPEILTIEEVFAPYLEIEEMERDMTDLQDALQKGELASIGMQLRTFKERYPSIPESINQGISGGLEVEILDGDKDAKGKLQAIVDDGLQFIKYVRHRFLASSSDNNFKFNFDLKKDGNNLPYYELRVRLKDLGLLPPPDHQVRHEIATILKPFIELRQSDGTITNQLNSPIIERLTVTEFDHLVKLYLKTVLEFNMGSTIPEMLSTPSVRRSNPNDLNIRDIFEPQHRELVTEYGKRVSVLNSLYISGIPFVDRATGEKITSWFKERFSGLTEKLPYPQLMIDLSIFQGLRSNDRELLAELDMDIKKTYARHMVARWRFGYAQIISELIAFKFTLGNRLKVPTPADQFLSFGNIILAKSA